MPDSAQPLPHKALVLDWRKALRLTLLVAMKELHMARLVTMGMSVQVRSLTFAMRYLLRACCRMLPH